MVHYIIQISHTHTHTHIYTYIHTHTHAQRHTHTHTYIHTYILIHLLPLCTNWPGTKCLDSCISNSNQYVSLTASKKTAALYVCDIPV